MCPETKLPVQILSMVDNMVESHLPEQNNIPPRMVDSPASSLQIPQLEYDNTTPSRKDQCQSSVVLDDILSLIFLVLQIFVMLPREIYNFASRRFRQLIGNDQELLEAPVETTVDADLHNDQSKASSDATYTSSDQEQLLNLLENKDEPPVHFRATIPESSSSVDIPTSGDAKNQTGTLVVTPSAVLTRNLNSPADTMPHQLTTGSDSTGETMSLRGGGTWSDWECVKRRKISAWVPDFKSPRLKTDLDSTIAAMNALEIYRPGAESRSADCLDSSRLHRICHPTPSTYQALPSTLRVATRSYLRGSLMYDWSRKLNMPLMDMFLYLRFCLIMLLEAENPDLRAITRDPYNFQRFRSGLSQNFLISDSWFVVQVRKANPKLHYRLCDLSKRVRIYFAFHTVDFPQIMIAARNNYCFGGIGVMCGR
ncbi:hypothetical protein GGR57DRAFT_449893 [Xylariaceae sp. FL1272]|nr:hypothetical protein GGR57DRAFT_449893 [Xylariaceae sp. FL1272]